MDPWNTATTPKADSAAVRESEMSYQKNCFDDNFVNTVMQSTYAEPHSAPKLADSDKYLDRLYDRLSRLQQATSTKNLLASIQDSRDTHLVQLLRTTSPSDLADHVSAVVTSSYLQRRLLPQTVPVSEEELLRLLPADQLQLAHQEVPDDGGDCERPHGIGETAPDKPSR